MELTSRLAISSVVGIVVLSVLVFLFAVPIQVETSTPMNGAKYFTSPSEDCVEDQDHEEYISSTDQDRIQTQVYGYLSEVKTCSFTVDDTGSGEVSFFSGTSGVSDGEFSDNDVLTLDIGFA